MHEKEICLRGDPDIRMGVHMPPALIGRWANGQEVGQGLPPYAPVAAYRVDDLPGIPEDWRSTTDVDAYVVGLEEARGMWFDFTRLPRHRHDVAVRLSVQGVCALTGMNVSDGRLPLHQYRNRCPKHDIAFAGNLYCDACGHEWPPQNYLATTGDATMWIDGYRAADGKTRQFLVTADESRGIAAQLIGAERTFDLTFAFFLSRERKPAEPAYRSALLPDDPGPLTFGGGDGLGRGYLRGGGRVYGSNAPAGRSVRSIEIGAGALINQRIGRDPKDMNEWNDERAGTVRLHYMPAEALAPILAERARQGEQRSGFLGALNAGNPPQGSGKKKF